jgi:serine beta-lactamase-like protein LACTB, mitochondrial
MISINRNQTGSRRIGRRMGRWTDPERGTVARFVLVSVLVLAGALGSHVQAQVPELAEVVAADDHIAQIREARRLTREMMAESGTPGVSVAVGRNGRLLWSEGFGWADVELKAPVTTLTKFRVGSVSKPMTAAAMALLVDDGRLDLDRTIQTYVPDFPEKRWPITSREVAGHLAGIRHYRGLENLNADRYDDVTSGLAIFSGDTLLFEPGSAFSYSSYGWNLLSAVVEGAAGEDFLPLMRDRVFEPLGMLHTVADHTDSIVGDRTSFYVRDRAAGKVVNAPFVDNSYKWAGGGFLSTPEDLVRFGSAHLNDEFISQETLDEWFTSQKLSDGTDSGYGIGWFVKTDDSQGRIVNHAGGSIGGTTMLLVNRDTGIVVVAVGNMSGVPIPTLGRAIMATFEGH